MRKYLSLILLIIILFISNGGYLYFKYLQQNIQREVKREIRKGLKDKDLTLIIVSSKNDKEIIWTKKNKEFKYRGFLYDIVKIKIKEGKKYYYCINDLKEKQLIATFHRTNRRRNKLLLKLKKVLNNKYFPEIFSIQVNKHFAIVSYAECERFYKSISLENSSPPPKI